MSECTDHAQIDPSMMGDLTLDTNSMPQDEIVATVVSTDQVWAKLLTMNLSARGISVIHGMAGELDASEEVSIESDWLILDVAEAPGAGTIDWDALIRFRRGARLAITVDSEFRPSKISEIRPDAVIEKSADMRVMARKLIETLNASPIQTELTAFLPRW